MVRRKAPPEPENQSAAGLLAGSLFLGFLGQLCFRFDWSVITGLLLYFAAAFIFVRSLGQYRSNDGAIEVGSDALGGRLSALSSTKGIEWLLVFALLSVAAFFRLYRIDSQPASIGIDESLTGLNALAIIEGKNAPIWQMTPLDPWKPDWVKTSNLYLHYVVGIFKIFGTGYFGLKMVSVLPAIASVVAVYFLFKQISNVPTAFLSAYLTAVSQWHVTISRWGWDAVLMCFLQLVSYCYLIRGAKTGTKRHFVVSGALMGLCLYTYLAAWLAFLIALAFLTIRVVLERAALRGRLQDIVAFFLPCLFVLAPLIVYYVDHPRDLTVRVSEVTLATAIKNSHSYRPVWANVSKYALMFNYKGDTNPRHGFPGEPALDFATSIFFVLGLAYCVRFWKRPQNLFVLLWFTLGIQAGLFSEPSASPHAYRTLIIAPVTLFFAANAVRHVWGANLRWLPSFRYRSLTVLILGIALFGYLALENYSIYFIRRVNSPEVWQEEGRDGQLPARIQSLQNQPQLIMVDPLLVWKLVLTNSWFLTYRPGKLYEPPFLPASFLIAESKLARYSGERQLIYFYSIDFNRMIRSLFPDAESEVVLSPGGDPVHGVLKIDVAHLRERLQSTDKDQFADALTKLALFYERQLLLDAEIGPRRKLLVDEAQTALELARKLRR